MYEAFADEVCDLDVEPKLTDYFGTKEALEKVALFHEAWGYKPEHTHTETEEQKERDADTGSGERS